MQAGSSILIPNGGHADVVTQRGTETNKMFGPCSLFWSTFLSV